MLINSTPQFWRGKKVEEFLDEYFRWAGWGVYPMSPFDERVLHLGDRYFIQGQQVLKIEYKSGLQTAYTGNLFFETISVDTVNKPGWVYSCNADFIMYATLLNNKILVFKPTRLRAAIERLKAQFRVTRTSHNQNDGYNGYGVLVPLAYAEEHLAERVIEL